MVPNSYHWQRMLLPYGRKKIIMNYIFHDTLVNWTDNNETTIPEMPAFVEDVNAAGGAFKPDENYLVAAYWCIYHNNETRAYSVLVGDQSPSYWAISNPKAARYVLVW
jgi:hypothetical protein